MTRRTRPNTSTSPAAVAIGSALQTPQGLWRAARVLAAKAMWTQAPGLHALQPHFSGDSPLVDKCVSTMGVDKWFRCYISEDFVMYMRDAAKAVSPSNPCPTCGATKHFDLAYVAGVICHEASHCIRKHSKRAETFGVPRSKGALHQWNVAADLALNDDLLETYGLLGATKGECVNKLCLPHFAAIEAANSFTAYKDPSKSFVWVTMQKMHFATDDIPVIEEIDIKNRVSLKSDTPFSFTAQYDGTTFECEGDVEGTFYPGQSVNICGTPLVFKAKRCLHPELFRVPGFAERANFPNDQTVEYYYIELNKLKEENKKDEDDGDEEGEAGDQPGPFPSGQGEGDPVDCGSGAHGGQGEHELGPPTADNPGVSEAETDAIRKEIADKIKDAAARHGTMARGMQLWADEVLTKSQVKWQTVLRRMMRNACVFKQGHDVRTFRRLGRASASSGYTLAYPSTHTPKPRVGVVLDTSGSMGWGPGSLLHEAMSEVEGICKQLGAEVVFVSVDAAAGEVQEIASFREAALQGGGGTDMRVGIDALARLKKPVNTCVVLTDGETPWPDQRPRKLKIIAGIVGPGPTFAKIPDFIKVVEIGKDQ